MDGWDGHVVVSVLDTPRTWWYYYFIYWSSVLLDMHSHKLAQKVASLHNNNNKLNPPLLQSIFRDTCNVQVWNVNATGRERYLYIYKSWAELMMVIRAREEELVFLGRRPHIYLLLNPLRCFSHLRITGQRLIGTTYYYIISSSCVWMAVQFNPNKIQQFLFGRVLLQGRQWPQQWRVSEHGWRWWWMRRG